jgi:predicted nucleotidyltransferase
MLDKNVVVDTVRQYAVAVVNELSPEAVVLFGSYANGDAHDDSDIDVAVIFNGFTGDWWKTTTLLWKLGHDISFDIEPHLLDITKDKSGFARFIYNTGQVVYQA